MSDCSPHPRAAVPILEVPMRIAETVDLFPTNSLTLRGTLIAYTQSRVNDGDGSSDIAIFDWTSGSLLVVSLNDLLWAQCTLIETTL